jgi:enediyne polyketide synthase
VIARERERDRDTFVYDVEAVADDGTLLESWEGLKLRRMSVNPLGAVWPLPLLAPYLERMIADRIAGSPVSIVLQRASNADRRDRSDSAILSALGDDGIVLRRPDGRPEAIGERFVSASHCADVTMAVAGSSTLGCDIESVTRRSVEIWKDLLAEEGVKLAQVVSRLMGEDADVAATRVWAAVECLRKCGAPVDARLMFSDRSEGCVVLSSGGLSILTACVRIAGLERVVLAVLTGLNTPANGRDHSVLGYEAAGV